MAFDPQRYKVLTQLSVDVLCFVALVNYKDVVAHVTQVLSFTSDHAIARDQDTPVLFEFVKLSLSVLLFLVLKLHNVRSVVAPLVQLCLPVALQRGRDHYKDLLDLVRIEETFEERTYLNSFTEAHVVTQHTTFTVSVQFVEPLNASFLVLEQVLVNLRWKAKALWQVIGWILRVKLEAVHLLLLCQFQPAVDVFLRLFILQVLRANSHV